MKYDTKQMFKGNNFTTLTSGKDYEKPYDTSIIDTTGARCTKGTTVWTEFEWTKKHMESTE